MGTDQKNVDRVASKRNGIAQHSSESNEHYTPIPIVEVAREVMGSIDLDPASCALANREIVRADRFFTKADDGLSRDWNARTVFVNPPGGRLYVDGKRTNRSQAQAFWFKAVSEWEKDPSRTICFLGFTLELLRLSQFRNENGSRVRASWDALYFPFCVLRERTDFLIERNGRLIEQGDPTHANVLICITSSFNTARRFEQEAYRLGSVITPTGVFHSGRTSWTFESQ
jgi:hypothetical protein